jgi:hypothetical protein
VRNVLSIPFVEYARGDGLSIGPGQDLEWQAVHLDPPPAWLTGYRGLWGLFVRDPTGGENAPAGPMFNRDGTPRSAWYDPLGYAGLNQLPPPPDELKRLRAERRAVERRQRQLRQEIEEKLDQLQTRGARRLAYQGLPTLQREETALAADLATEGARLKALRRELSLNETVAAALRHRIRRLERGEEDPPLAHVTILQTPSTSDELRFVRLTEFWAAITIGLLVFGFLLLVQFAPGWILAGGLALVVVVALIESIFRGTYPRMIRDITMGLAALTLLVLVYDHFRAILIGGLVLGALLLTVQNLREALAPAGKRPRRRKTGQADPARG